MASRWPAVVWVHPPAVAWATGTVVISVSCLLTSLEKWLRHAAGDARYGGGFVDHYIELVIYPEACSSLLRSPAVVVVVGAYGGLHRKTKQSRPSASRGC